jgi:hypothetical protein
VILVSDELDLEGKREGLEATAARSDTQFFHFRPWIISIEKDIRINLELPFPRTIADQLRRIVTVFVEHISEDLEAAPGTLQRPVTAAPKLKKLQSTGEDILADLGLYAKLADHFFDEKVESARLGRTTDKVSDEVAAIGGQAKDLWKKILEYLNDLKGAITDAYGLNEIPN